MSWRFEGRGGGRVDRAADSGPCVPSLIPLSEKKENKQKRGPSWPILKQASTNLGPWSAARYINQFLHQ